MISKHDISTSDWGLKFFEAHIKINQQQSWYNNKKKILNFTLQKTQIDSHHGVILKVIFISLRIVFTRNYLTMMKILKRCK